MKLFIQDAQTIHCPLILTHILPFVPGYGIRIPVQRHIVVTGDYFRDQRIGIPALGKDISVAQFLQFLP